MGKILVRAQNGTVHQVVTDDTLPLEVDWIENRNLAAPDVRDGHWAQTGRGTVTNSGAPVCRAVLSKLATTSVWVRQRDDAGAPTTGRPTICLTLEPPHTIVYWTQIQPKAKIESPQLRASSPQLATSSPEKRPAESLIQRAVKRQRLSNAITMDENTTLPGVLKEAWDQSAATVFTPAHTKLYGAQRVEEAAAAHLTPQALGMRTAKYKELFLAAREEVKANHMQEILLLNGGKIEKKDKRQGKKGDKGKGGGGGGKRRRKG